MDQSKKSITVTTASTSLTEMSQVQTTAVPPIWSCDTHRRSHNQQRELKQQQQLQLSILLTELRRSTNHWFQTKGDDCFQLLVQTCVQILQHGLLQPATSGAMLVSDPSPLLALSQWPDVLKSRIQQIWQTCIAIKIFDYMNHMNTHMHTYS